MEQSFNKEEATAFLEKRNFITFTIGWLLVLEENKKSLQVAMYHSMEPDALKNSTFLQARKLK